MKDKKLSLYLFLFVLLTIVVIISRFYFNTDELHKLLLFTWPISVCFLIWMTQSYTFKKRTILSLLMSVLGLLLWYNPLFSGIYIALPFLSGALAILSSHFVEKYV